MAQTGEHLVHGSCVALGERAALLRGAPGAGKSDLALRFISAFAPAGAVLVADDQVRLRRAGGMLQASPPANLAGRLEVRGIGIITLAHRPRARLELIVTLTRGDAVPRLPPDPLPCEVIFGLPVPVLSLDPFEASAAVKLKLALGGGV